VWRLNKPKTKKLLGSPSDICLVLRFLPHFYFCDSSVRVHPFVYALPSSSILKHIYRHKYIYTCFEYSVMSPYNLFTNYNASLCTCLYRLLPCSRVDAYTMRGNTIRVLWIHHEIHKATCKQSFIHQINTTCVYSIHHKICNPTNQYIRLPEKEKRKSK